VSYPTAGASQGGLRPYNKNINHRVVKEATSTNSSDLFLAIAFVPAFLIDITLSLGDSTLAGTRLGPRQKADLSAFIAH
jgi:hypothetical protein